MTLPSLTDLEADLARAEDQMARGVALVRRQIGLIHRLSAEGYDTALARKLLSTMIGVSRAMQCDVARIEGKIADAQAKTTRVRSGDVRTGAFEEVTWQSQ